MNKNLTPPEIAQELVKIIGNLQTHFPLDSVNILELSEKITHLGYYARQFSTHVSEAGTPAAALQANLLAAVAALNQAQSDLGEADELNDDIANGEISGQDEEELAEWRETAEYTATGAETCLTEATQCLEDSLPLAQSLSRQRE